MILDSEIREKRNFINLKEPIISKVVIRKDAIKDLVRVKDEFSSIVESLELMSDKEFMNSYKKSKNQIKKRDFADRNEL